MNIWPFSTIIKLRKEIDRLSDLIKKQAISEITLEDISINNGISMSLSGSPLHLFAEAFGKQFYESGAVNFLTMDFYHESSAEKFEVTMQKISGESVCDQLKRLRSELDDLKS